MKIKIISCWFRTSYGTYTDGLRRGLERKLGHEVGVIGSNCGCGDPKEVNRMFMDRRCEFVEFPNVPHWKMSTKAKQWVLDSARKLAYRERARRYLARSGDADVLHFQQILNAFGSLAFHYWISQPARAARVVTVHELDPYQQGHPELAAAYNKADGVIVHTQEMRRSLLALGVTGDRIHVIHHGIDVPSATDQPRAGIVYYAGHKLGSNKGLATLFAAIAILKERLGSATPVVAIHGHYGEATPEYGSRCAVEAGVSSHVRWLNEISFEHAVAEYQKALLCVLPYTGSFAGYAATLALANCAPVIGTRRAGLPEHVGEAGSWVEENNPNELASTIARLIEDDGARKRLAEVGRARALGVLSWDAVAAQTLHCYEQAMRREPGHGRAVGTDVAQKLEAIPHAPSLDPCSAVRP